VCPARAEDCEAEEIRRFFPNLKIIHAAPGLPAQRNALLNATRSDIVIFFDDDFIPAADFVAETRDLFAAHPGIVVATGELIADGIIGPGLEPDEGYALLSAAQPSSSQQISDVHNAYGCNMVVRMEPVRAAGITFDEALPLHGWLEDVDFSRRLLPYGRIVKAATLRGVHLGTKKGRTRGRRLGYSQIANPLYLHSKGTLSIRRALAQMGRNVAANAGRSFNAEPWVDRRGRLTGNVIGFRDLVMGRLRPGRILELD
jgi:GT2 family glycosyltransferase